MRVATQALTAPTQPLAAPAKFEAESPLRATAMQSLLWPEVPSLFTSNFGVAARFLDTAAWPENAGFGLWTGRGRVALLFAAALMG